MNNNNDISKFNGQYLKCIITKHKGTMNALSDMGALIIYQNDNRNYAYLGNVFIASGYGFNSLENLEKTEKIIGSYDEDIQKIQDNLLNTIKLNNDSIDEKIDNAVLNKLKVYDVQVKYNNGEDEDEYADSYNLNDIFFRGPNATYKDFEFTKISKKLLVNNKIDTEDNYINVDESNVVELPVGTKINKIVYELEYEKNDTSGIKSLEINYFKSYDDFINGKLSYVIYKIDVVNSNANSGVINITFTFENEYFYVINNNQELFKQFTVIDSITVYILGTNKTQYKNYSYLSTEDYKKIYSLENIIDNHYKTFDDKLYIKPISLLYYRFNEFKITNNVFQDNNNIEMTLGHISKNIMINPINYNNQGNSLSMILDSDKDESSFIEINKTNINDIFDICIPITNYNFNTFTFFIPDSYKIHKLLYVTDNSEYNLTGSLGYIEYINYDEKPIYVKGPLNLIRENDINYFYKSKIYQFTINNGALKHKNSNKEFNGFFKIELLCINRYFDKDVYNKENYNTNNTNIESEYYESYISFRNLKIGECTSWVLLNDEEFNRIHWLSYMGNLNVLKNRLDFISETILDINN